MRSMIMRINTLIMCFIVIVMCVGCSNSSENKVKDTISKNEVVDVKGNEVNLPKPEELKRIVTVTPPIVSVMLGIIPDKNMIVGVNPRTFSTSNEDVIKEVFPEYKNVNKSFVDEKFVTNTEELLSLSPDIVFYYGDGQKRD